MYILKHIPEDFIVKEKNNLEFQPQGRHLYFLLRKKNKNTLEAIQDIARAVHVSEKDIGFAGSKDRNAITEQVISITGVKKDNLLNLNLKDIQLTFLGYRDQPLSLGELAGNEFNITVRNLEQKNIKLPHYVVNYFDEQRFSEKNIEIGKYLITKKFAEAVHLLGNHKLEIYLQRHQNDYVGALKLLPSRLLRLYLNAYQAWLWNETVAVFLSQQKNTQKVPYTKGEFVFVKPTKDLLNTEIPLIGADYQPSEQVETIIPQLLQRENISPADFILRQFPNLTLMGENRKIFVEIQDFQIQYLDDELNSGKKKAVIQFSLPKGSYATIVIKSLF